MGSGEDVKEVLRKIDYELLKDWDVAELGKDFSEKSVKRR